MTREFKIFVAFLKINIQAALAYRVNTLIDFVVSIIWLTWELLSLSIIYNNTETVGGWTNGDMLVLLGVWKILHTLIFAVIYPSTEYFNKAVQQGTLDYVFLMPVNSQFLVSINRITVWQMHNLLQAAVMIPLGLSMTQHAIQMWDVVAFGLLAICGILLIYSLWIVLIAAVFWFTKFDNNVTILSALMDAGRFPASVYPIWLRILITFVVPIAAATTVPVQALRGELPLWQIGLWVLFAVAVFWVSSRIWRAGVRQYSGASA
jgi:ABC-2 type transport system permease protein